MKLCLALDLQNDNENIKLLKKIKGFDIWIKVGLKTYIRNGKEILKQIKQIDSNFKIFLDLKLYDIPHTTKEAALEIASLDVDMFNIHASIGDRAMSLMMSELNKLKKRPLVLAVTALTSFDEESFFDVYNCNLENKVLDFSKMAYKNGLDGVVCSVFESAKIKKITNKNFLTLTPAIKVIKNLQNDQKRVASIEEAKKKLCDFIVVGRAIYQSNNPKKMIKEIIKQINN